MSNIPYPDYDTDGEPGEDPGCTLEEWAEELREENARELERPEPTPTDWADAVAIRLSSEWNPDNRDPELEETIHRVLYEALKDRRDLTEQLVGTFVVEESYFDTLDVAFPKRKSVTRPAAVKARG